LGPTILSILERLSGYFVQSSYSWFVHRTEVCPPFGVPFIGGFTVQLTAVIPVFSKRKWRNSSVWTVNLLTVKGTLCLVSWLVV